jgi:hypothetical protein
MVLASCDEDSSTTPLVADWELNSIDCADAQDDRECFTLSVAARGEGDGMADCRIYALADDGVTEMRQQGTTITGLAIRAGALSMIDVELPHISDPRFLRWQAACDPGAPE